MIQSFATTDTEHIWSGLRAKCLPSDILADALDEQKCAFPKLCTVVA